MESHSVAVFVVMPQSLDIDVTSRMEPIRPTIILRKVVKSVAFLIFRS